MTDKKEELKKECLVSRAMDKCQCKFCVEQRKYRACLLEQQIKWEAYKIWIDAIESATKEKEKTI